MCQLSIARILHCYASSIDGMPVAIGRDILTCSAQLIHLNKMPCQINNKNYFSSAKQTYHFIIGGGQRAEEGANPDGTSINKILVFWPQHL